MKHILHRWTALFVLIGLYGAAPSMAQTTCPVSSPFCEDFTGTTTNNSWYFFGGACLTAGTAAASGNPGLIPSCTSLLSSYYSKATNADPYLVGGNSGYLGSTSAPGSISAQQPDPSGSGALRFTNGSAAGKYGHFERGAILSTNTFSTNAGIEVTFKTVTYHGDSGGAGADGADGISFFLQDGSQTPGLGANGGSLAYSCSNATGNAPLDGLTGAYVGVGIDEYGNFLNGTSLVSSYTGSNSATGDNTAYGYGYKPGRIGLRGAGSVSFYALSTAYGTNPNNTALPYYPSSLSTSCLISGGVYSSSGGNCIDVCSAGSTYDPVNGLCNQACPSGYVYSGTATDKCNSCPSGTYDTTTQQCVAATCPASGYATGTYNSNGTCSQSCPTGYALGTYSGGGYCYPTGGTFSNGNYCPSGQVMDGTGAYCYPSGNVFGSGHYCSSTSASPTAYNSQYYCYPSTATFLSGTYCASGKTIVNYSGTNYCYPTGDAYSTDYYCTTSGYSNTAASPTECCPSGYTYSSGTTCKNGTATATAKTATKLSTVATTATVAGTATAVTAASAAQTVTAANKGPTQKNPTTSSPTTALVDSQYAIQKTCSTGLLYNYAVATAPTSAGPATAPTDPTNPNPVNVGNAAATPPLGPILDYAPLPNAYVETTFQIANESAVKRGDATPIFYDLKISPAGLLSFAYSVKGGAYSYLIKDQSIITSNGPLPSSFRVGFAGSDGGASNVHEIMCFKAAPSNQASGSASVNQKQASKVEAGTQAYFALYSPDDWTGTVTANTLVVNASTGAVTVNTTANWDASCVLNGTGTSGCANTGSTAAAGANPTPAGRVILTWDTINNKGIPFEWGSLNSSQQAALDFGDTASFGDSSTDSPRLDYLRGVRTNEVNSLGVGLFRIRDNILGDIVDSSPTWVGPPSSAYTGTWIDHLYTTATMAENSGQSYVQFTTAEQTRLNVVYAGANDGFLHGFEAGSYDSSGAYVSTGNDGQEVLAYIPGSLLASAALPSATGGCTIGSSTETVVQSIHGVTPAVNSKGECVGATLDYSNPKYGHNFFVDATPATGDLYYGSAWHTWLVGGLGAGGAAIYALDVTDPTTFAEGSASNLVIGEWSASSITTCPEYTNTAGPPATNCGSNLGNTFGTPLIRRLHDGNWAIIFGNGFGSATGDAGVFIITIDGSSGKSLNTYYLSTNTAGKSNGIAYVTSADLDGDHITDYLYAGDLLGNVWRFDLTSNDEANWAAGAAPLFTTQSGQPITSQLLVVSSIVSGGAPRVLVEFGTGDRTQLTNVGPVQYASGTQALYGVWDWNMAAWNTLSPGSAYASLAATNQATGLSSPYTATQANLQVQTLQANANGATVDGTNIAICWQGSLTACGTGSFGWFSNLPGASEQIIYNPVYYQGAIIINSTIPANNIPTTCDAKTDTGYTYVLNIANGGVFPSVFPTYSYVKNGTVITVTDPIEAGVLTNATGSVAVVNTTNGVLNLVYQTVPGVPGTQQPVIPSNTKAKRLTWVEKR